MHDKASKGLLTLTLVVIFLIAAGSGTLQAENFVSWDGGYYFSYPDHWKKIDYRTVDAFLLNQSDNREILNYEVVLADTISRPFSSGEYMIVTHTASGNDKQQIVDSLLENYRGSFRTGVRHATLTDFMKNRPRDIPYWDKNLAVMAVASNIKRDGKIIKGNLVLTKVYQGGLVEFYLYAPDSVFEATIDLSKALMESFSTENLDAAAPKEDVKVANLPEPSKASDDDDENSIPPVLWIVPIMIIIVIVIIRRRKK